MLLMLLFIHSIKLLHSHASIFPGTSCKNTFSDSNETTEKATSSDCSICSYQLGKDADDFVQLVFDINDSEHNVFVEQLISSYNDPFSAGFDSRGPPQL